MRAHSSHGPDQSSSKVGGILPAGIAGPWDGPSSGPPDLKGAGSAQKQVSPMLAPGCRYPLCLLRLFNIGLKFVSSGNKSIQLLLCQ